jgi:sugar/nucleoside kinase (ribokinase family)
MYDIITFGAATRDIFVRSDAFEVHESGGPMGHFEGCFPLGAKIDIKEMAFETGGGGTNAAATFGRLGWKSAVVCAVGDDSVARDIAEAMKKDDVTSALFQRDPRERTGVSVIILAGSGERTILNYRGASSEIKANRIPWPKVRAKWFYCSSLGGNLGLLKKILVQAKRVGAKVAWNPGNKELAHGLEKLIPLIRQVDIFNLNKEEAAALTGHSSDNLTGIIAKIRAFPRRALIVTDGQKGTYAAEGDATWHSGIVDVPRRNTTGAGDAFGSGFVAGLLKSAKGGSASGGKDDLRYALAVGTWNATGVVQHMGAKVGLLRRYPTAKQVGQVKIERLD